MTALFLASVWTNLGHCLGHKQSEAEQKMLHFDLSLTDRSVTTSSKLFQVQLVNNHKLITGTNHCSQKTSWYLQNSNFTEEGNMFLTFLKYFYELERIQIR